ncbi:MAG: GIY-YIG nuclease family protein, partial [Gemmatimonadales bacterium]
MAPQDDSEAETNSQRVGGAAGQRPHFTFHLFCPTLGPMPWYVYLVRCGDGTLYTGVATDLARRVAEHNAGRGAKYT